MGITKGATQQRLVLFAAGSIGQGGAEPGGFKAGGAQGAAGGNHMRIY